MAYGHSGLGHLACDEGAASCPCAAREPSQRLGGTTVAGIRSRTTVGTPPTAAARHEAQRGTEPPGHAVQDRVG